MTKANLQSGTNGKNTRTPSGFKHPEQRFWGRRKGNKLSDRRQKLLKNLLPVLSIDPEKWEKGALDTAAVFSQPVEDVWFEAGFGKGEHLCWQARRNPKIGFIGCEPFLNGVAGILSDIEKEALSNIRIYADDARHIMETLPAHSLGRFFLLQPDPWPKYRHARRRFINPFNLDQISRILKSNGEFRVSTDDPVYKRWLLMQMCQRQDFEWTAEKPCDCYKKPEDWPETRYTKKAIRGKVSYFIFRKTDIDRKNR